MERIGHLKDHEGTSYRMETEYPYGAEHCTRTLMNSGHGRVEADKAPHIGLVRTPQNVLKFAGIFVPPEMRKEGWAEILMETGFMIGEALGTPIQRTVSIRKPLIALLLEKYGFKPDRAQVLTEILPRENPEDSVPKVRIATKLPTFLQDPRNPTWYSRVDGEIDASSGNHIVAIGTPYHLEDEKMCMAMREQVREQIDGRLRIFPKRVRRAVVPPN